MRSLKLLLTFLAVLIQSVALAAANWDRDDEWYLRTADNAALLYVREIGKGEPVVVLHGGFGAEYSYLLDAVQGLTSKYHFIFYDQRGSLRSPCKIESVNYEAHIQDLETLRQALGLEKLNLFAHSMGTMLAVSYMNKYPDHVGRVVLAGCLPLKSGKFLSSAYGKMTNMNEGAQIMSDRSEVKEEITKEKATKEGSAKMRTHLWRIAFAGSAIYHADRWRQMKGGMVFYNQDAGSKASNEMYRQLTNDYDFSDWFLKHTYAATVISGDHDYADFGNGFFKVYSKEVPIHYEILKDAGHNMWIDNPIGFRRALSVGLGS